MLLYLNTPASGSGSSKMGQSAVVRNAIARRARAAARTGVLWPFPRRTAWALSPSAQLEPWAPAWSQARREGQARSQAQSARTTSKQANTDWKTCGCDTGTVDGRTWEPGKTANTYYRRSHNFRSQDRKCQTHITDLRKTLKPRPEKQHILEGIRKNMKPKPENTKLSRACAKMKPSIMFDTCTMSIQIRRIIFRILWIIN